MQNKSKNTSYVLKANLKQNLISSSVWLLVLVGLFAAVATKFNGLFGTKGDIDAIINTLKTPAMVSLFGEFSAVKPYTTANVFASEMLVFMGMFVVFMNIFIVVHDTRAQEENGITEMIRSRQVGRRASLNATVIEVLGINLIAGMLFFLSLLVAQLKGDSIEGNILIALSLACVGIMFGMICLFASQLTASSRGANFLSYGIFAAMYLVRMMTDVSNPDLTWISPFGWLSKTKIYTDNNFLPILLMLVLSLVAYAVSAKIVDTRDIDSGLFEPKPGKAKGGRFLASPFGLVMRLERNSMIGWTVGMLVLGVTYGSIFGTVGDIIGTNPTYKKILGITQIKEANLDLLLSFMGMLGIFFVTISVVSGLMILFRLKTDESKGYLEILHSKKTSRTSLALSYYISSLILGVLGLAASNAATFFTGNAGLDDPIPMKYFWRALGANVPGVLFFLAVAFCIVCIVPKLTTVMWGYVSLSMMVKMFGPLLDLPKVLINISPLGWIGKVPQHAPNMTAIVLMLVAFVLLSVVGLIGYNKRDV